MLLRSVNRILEIQTDTLRLKAQHKTEWFSLHLSVM